MVSIKDVVRSSVKVPEFDKHLKKAGGHIGRNVVEITIKMKTIVRKTLMTKIQGSYFDSLNIDLINLEKKVYSKIGHFSEQLYIYIYVCVRVCVYIYIWILCMHFICFGFCLLLSKLELVGHREESSTLMQFTQPEIWKWHTYITRWHSRRKPQYEECLGVNLRRDSYSY